MLLLRYIMRSLLLLALIFIGSILVLWTILFVLRVEIPLENLRQPLETMSHAAIGRPIRITGEVKLAHRFLPTLHINGVVIPNREFQAGTLLQIEHLTIELDPMALLLMNINVEEVYATGVRLSLLQDEDDHANWDFLTPPSLQRAASNPVSRTRNMGLDSRLSANLELITLEDMVVQYRDSGTGLEIQARIDQLSGHALWEEDIQLILQGEFEDQPATMWVRGDRLQQLFSNRREWRLDTTLALQDMYVHTHYKLLPEPVSREREESLLLTMQGPSLNALGAYFDADLPDWGPWQLVAEPIMLDDGYVSKQVMATVGDTSLQGELDVSDQGGQPSWRAKIHRGHLQMDDFPLADQMSPPDEDEIGGIIARPDAIEPEAEILGFSEASLQGFDFSLSAENVVVYAGAEVLGTANLDARLNAQGVRIAPFHIEEEEAVGGGTLFFQPRGSKLYSEISLQAKAADYGILLRRTDPEAENTGLIDARIQIKGFSSGLEDILSHADGEIAVTLWPENYVTKELDTWAAGLLSTSVDQYGGPSHLNCVVARFALEDGIASDRAVLMDTTGIRVFGEGTIDFRRNEIDLYLIPKPKKRAFLNLAVPVRLRGGFKDFDYGVKGTDVIQSYFRNYIRVFLAGIPVLFQKELVEDGSPVCRLAMQQDIDIRHPKNLDQLAAEAEGKPDTVPEQQK